MLTGSVPLHASAPHAQAYRREALKWHPDKNTDRKEVAERRFKEISDAYRLLSDPDERAHFDRYGGRPQQQRRPQQQYGGGGHVNAEDLTPEDIFNMFFGMPPGAQRRPARRQQPQNNARADGVQMNLTLFQLLPVVMLMFFSILSSASFGMDSQSFGLHRSADMPIERRTLRTGAFPTPTTPTRCLAIPALRAS
jgi:DnaJ family protein B protein 12